MSVSVDDAANRRIVSWGDGRTGRLVSIPGPSSPHRHGRRAVVRLPSGAHLSVDPNLLVITQPKETS